MWNHWNRITVCLGLILALTACGDIPSESSPQPEEPVISDDSADGDTEVVGQYQSLFSDPESDQLFVSHHTEDGVELYAIDDGQTWANLRLPEPLLDKPDLQISSVVSTEFDLLISTDNHGAWRHQPDHNQWIPLAPEWLDGDSRITRLRKIRDQVYAYNEVAPHAPEGIELWERNELDWNFVRNDMFMIIDYIPRPTMLVRSTRYGTVEISRDDGDTWEIVSGVFSDVAPQLFEWNDELIVATTTGIWATDDEGQSWEKLSDHNGWVGALMEDELIVAGADGTIGAVDLSDHSTTPLPQLPPGTLDHLDLAVSGTDLFVTTGNDELLELSADRDHWELVDPAQL